MYIETNDLENKIPVDETFIAAICDAKKAAIDEITDIVGCFHDDKIKSNFKDNRSSFIGSTS